MNLKELHAFCEIVVSLLTCTFLSAVDVLFAKHTMPFTSALAKAEMSRVLQAHHAEGYKWWAQRLGRSFQLYDETRIDHFRGFAGECYNCFLLASH